MANVLRDTVVRIRVAFDKASATAAERGAKAIEKGLDSASKAGASLSNKLKATAAGLRKNTKEGRSLAAQSKELANKQRDLAARQRELRKDLKDLRTERKKTGHDTDELKAKEAALEHALKDTTDEFEKNARAVRTLASARAQLAADTLRLKNKEDDLKDAAARHAARTPSFRERAKAAAGRGARSVGRAAGRGLQRAGQGAILAGTAAVGVGAYAIGSEIKGSTEAAIEFERSFADVRKAVSGSDAELKAISDAAVRMSKEFPIAASGFNEIIAAAGQAGIAKEEIVDFAKEAAVVGVAFDISAGEAGDALAKLRTSLSLSTPEAKSLAGSINNLSNSLAATPTEVLSVVKEVGALGKVAGGSGEEIAALGGAMIASGATAEVAATGTKNLFLALSAGEAATDAQRKAFEKLGLTSEGVAQGLQDDFDTTIVDVLTRLKENTTAAERAGVAMDLFGKKSLGSIGPIIDNVDTLSKAFEVAQDKGAGLASLDREFAARSSTAANSLQLLANVLEAIRIEIGNAIVPVIKEAVKAFTGLSTQSGDFAKIVGQQVAEALRKLLAKFIELVGPPETLGDRLANLVDKFFKLVDVGVAVVSGLATLSDSLGGTTTAVLGMSAAVAAAAGPWGLLAVAALGVGTYLGNLLADITGVTERLNELTEATVRLKQETAKVRADAKSEVDRINEKKEADLAQYKKAAEGFSGAIGGDHVYEQTAVNIEIDKAVKAAVLKAQRKGQEVTQEKIDDAVQKARREASAVYKDFKTATLDDAKGRAVATVEDLFEKADKAEARTRTGGKGKKKQIGGEADLFEGVDDDVRSVIGGARKAKDLDVLSKGVLNEVRANKGLGAVAGSDRSAVGPNITNNTVNNIVNLDVDARGQDPTVVANLNRAGQRIGEDGIRLTGIMAAKLAAQNASGMR